MLTKDSSKIYGRKRYKSKEFIRENEDIETFLQKISENFTVCYQSDKMQPRIFAFIRIKSRRKKEPRYCIAGITEKEFNRLGILHEEFAPGREDLHFVQACRMAEYVNRDDIYEPYSDLKIYAADEEGCRVIATFWEKKLVWAKVDTFAYVRFRKFLCSLKLI